MSGKSADEIEKEYQYLTKDYSYTSKAAEAESFGSESGKNHAMEVMHARNAGILDDLHDAPPGATPEQIAEINRANLHVWRSAGLPEPGNGIVSAGMPNMQRYGYQIENQQKANQAAAEEGGRAAISGVPADRMYPPGTLLGDPTKPFQLPGGVTIDLQSRGQPAAPAPATAPAPVAAPPPREGGPPAPGAPPTAEAPAAPGAPRAKQGGQGIYAGTPATPQVVTDPLTGARTFVPPPVRSAAGITAEQRQEAAEAVKRGDIADNTIGQMARLRTLSRTVGQPGLMRSLTEGARYLWPGPTFTESGLAGEQLDRVAASLKGADPAIDAALAKTPEMHKLDPREIDALAAEATVNAEIAKQKADLARKAMNGEMDFNDYKIQANDLDATAPKLVQQRIAQFDKEAQPAAKPTPPPPAGPAPIPAPVPVQPPPAPVPAVPLLSGAPTAQAAPAPPAAAPAVIDWNDLGRQ
jgi:hypothetical protein